MPLCIVMIYLISHTPKRKHLALIINQKPSHRNMGKCSYHFSHFSNGDLFFIYLFFRIIRMTCPSMNFDPSFSVPQVKGYCFPGEFPCGPDEGCYSQHQRCDGYWHCPSGRDEEGCALCGPGQYPCQGAGGACYSAHERCDNQKQCPDGSDEKNCFSCQPGTFHCATNLCILETWRCDGQEDCTDGSDEHECQAAVPRKVITAALIGSLACGLLLVIALGCAFKLYSLRTREYR